MAARGTFDSKRAEARKLYDEGHSCRSIALKLDCSPSTVSRWAKEENLTFDREQTDLATRAHTVDMAADRLELAQMMITASRDMLLALDGSYLVYSFGGKENDYNEHLLDRAPVEVVRNAVTTAAIAFDKATRVIEATPEGLRGAESLLDRLEQDLQRFNDDADADDLVE